MLSVQSPAVLDMSPTDASDNAAAHWQWRPTHLPTPPSTRRSGKHHYAAQLAAQAHEHDYEHARSYEHPLDKDRSVTLPPIAHLDCHWPSTSPLTPPDDVMSSSPLWRDQKAGPSRLHSPYTENTSPLPASPSPSPIDEDEEYDHYDAMYEEQSRGKQEWNGDWTHQVPPQEYELDSEMEDSYAYPEPSQHVADWVTDYQKLSAHFIAEKTCEMVCYLWFSGSLRPGMTTSSRSRRHRATSHGRAPIQSLSHASTATLQFYASPEFVAFMQKLLETTQVSQSVIVLSLHYIYRLKEQNDFAVPKPGSEFRVAVCALMLANKFVDDNTYTNKTWSDVSSISLEELNKMEREFLIGVGYCLFVDETTYNSWLSLLKGLVLAKEREHVRWRSRSSSYLLPPIKKVISDGNGDAYSVCQSQPQSAPNQRARSSSPHRPRSYSYAPAYPFTFAVPTQARAMEIATQSLQASPVDKSGDQNYHNGKRTAADAFSPTTATFTHRTSKRPTGLALDINAALASVHSANAANAGAGNSVHQGRYSASLHSLERMSLDASTPIDTCDQSQRAPSHTLAAEYRGSDAARHAVPQHLYFYALASSPVHGLRTEDGSAPSSTKKAEVTEHYYPTGAERKAKLRYTQPATSYSYGQAESNVPNVYMPTYGQQTTNCGSSVNPALAYPTPAAVTRQSFNQSSARVHEALPQRPHSNLPPLTVALSQSGQASAAVAPIRNQPTHSAQPFTASHSPVEPALHCGCVAESAYCTPPSSSSCSSHPPPYAANYSHYHLQVPVTQTPGVAAAPSRTSPSHMPLPDSYTSRSSSSRAYTSSYSAIRSAQPEPAAFANAGPPGVASQFYQSSPLPVSYGQATSGGASTAAPSVPVPLVAHSANVSPSAWTYAGRGRCL